MAWSWHGDHGHYYNVVRTLIIQLPLLISNQVVVRYSFNVEYVERTHQKQPKRRLNKMNLCQKFEITKNNEKL